MDGFAQIARVAVRSCGAGLLGVLVGVGSAFAQSPAAADTGRGPAAPPDANARPQLCVIPPVNDGLREADARTFFSLFDGALRRNGVAVTALPSQAPCADDACARQVAEDNGCSATVRGQINLLGTRTIVSTFVIPLDGSRGSAQQISAARVEELDVVAERLAVSIATGRPVDEGQQLGRITEDESRPDTRLQFQNGMLVRMGGFVPLGGAFNDANLGGLGEIGYWGEGRTFAIETKLGLRWAADRGLEDLGGTRNLHLDMGAFWMASPRWFSPFFGGGFGLRWATAPGIVVERLGAALTYEQRTRERQGGFGFGTYARAGLMLLRTYRVRVSLQADYDVTFVEIGDSRVHQAFVFGAALHF